MKPNKFRERLAAGEIPVGHMISEFGTRSIAQLVAEADVDFVIVDMEHGFFSASQIADIMAWFQATAVAPFVRIPQTDYHFIARTMDAGALGVMVPNVRTAAQAQAVVDAAKYAPLGQRGVFLGGITTDFKSVDPPEFMAYSNENTTVICQIESEEGLENIEAIAATPGVDVLWLGHFDLTQSMGIPGQFHNPRFLEAMQKIIATAQAHGLAAAAQPGTVAQAQEWLDIGLNCFSYSADRSVYLQALSVGVADMRGLSTK